MVEIGPMVVALGGSSYAVYTGLLALALNVLVAVAWQVLFGQRGAQAPAAALGRSAG